MQAARALTVCRGLEDRASKTSRETGESQRVYYRAERGWIEAYRRGEDGRCLTWGGFEDKHVFGVNQNLTMIVREQVENQAKSARCLPWL